MAESLDEWAPPESDPTAPVIAKSQLCEACGKPISDKRRKRWCSATCKQSSPPMSRASRMKAPKDPTGKGRAPICVTNRVEDDVVSDAGMALVAAAAKCGWPIFRRSVDKRFRIVTPTRREDIAADPQHITRCGTVFVSNVGLRLLLDSCCWFFRVENAERGKTRRVGVKVPGFVIDSLLEVPPELPLLQGVIGHPYLWGGRLVSAPGYDCATLIWHAEHPIPARTDMAVEEAVDVLRGLLGEVPFEEADDGTIPGFASLVGRMLMPSVRTQPAQLGALQCPMTLFSKGDSQVGASTAARIAAKVGGSDESRSCTLGDSEELRKTITSLLLHSPDSAILFDNLPAGKIVNHPALAKLLTESKWTDRLLSTHDSPTLANRLIIDATGINPQLSNELVNRTLPIFLRATETDPTKKRWKKPHHELMAELDSDHTARSAVLSLVARWNDAGQPRSPDRHVWSTYQPLVDLISDVLHFAGLGPFAVDRDRLQVADTETASWREFLQRWYEAQNIRRTLRKGVSASVLLEHLVNEDSEPPKLAPVHLPGKSLGGDARSFGRALRQIKGRWFEIGDGLDASIALVESGNNTAWQLKTRPSVFVRGENGENGICSPKTEKVSPCELQKSQGQIWDSEGKNPEHPAFPAAGEQPNDEDGPAWDSQNRTAAARAMMGVPHRPSAASPPQDVEHDATPVPADHAHAGWRDEEF